MKVRIFFPLDPMERNQPVFDWLGQEGWCWGVEVSPRVSEKDIKALRHDGWNVLIHINAHKETLIRDSEYKNREIPDIEQVIQRHINAADGERDQVYWECILEDDSAGVAHPQELLKEKPKTYGHAKKLFDKHLDQVLMTAHQFPGVHLWGLCGYASGVHALARKGMECVILERANDDVEDLQTGIAFTRGAAKQFGCEWGIDFSLWWGVIYGCIQDLPSSFHRRQMFISYLSGAKTFRIEGGDLFYNHDKNELYPLAETVEEFGRFTEKYDPGKPDVPVAIILPEDHGWISPPYWSPTRTAWNYARIPYQQGYRTLDGFFGFIFPGNIYAMEPFPFGHYDNDDPPASPFALSCIVPRFAPSPDDVFYTEQPLPFGRFKSRKDARRIMHEQNMDTSPYRPMGDSRYGDIFDVFTSDVEVNILKDYKAVFVLGPVKLTSGLKETLSNYADQGGTLVWSAGVVGPEDGELTGVKIHPEFRVGRAWQWQAQSPMHEVYHYLPAQVFPESTIQVIASTSGGDPLIVKKTVGEGAIYTCTIPWFEGANQPLAGTVKQMMDYIIDPIQPVKVKGLPVEWVCATAKNTKTVLLSNNSGDHWAGEIAIRNIPQEMSRCRNLLTQTDVSFSRQEQEVYVNISVNPYDMVILQWENKQ